jgi:aldehyde:ferredoxin oxidoreductase
VSRGHCEGGGHAGFIEWLSTEGILSAKNAHYTGFQGAHSVDGGMLASKYGHENVSCAHCVGGCKRVYKTALPGLELRYGAPELETLSSITLGSEIEDAELALKACDLASRHGLDGTSTGVVVSFANECAEKGLLPREETDGLKLGFGRPEALVSLIEKIAHRDGIGRLFAEGVARASNKIGKGSHDFALHVKGMEVPLHDPRIKAMLGLGYAVNPNGLVYTTVEHDTDFDFSGS